MKKMLLAFSLVLLISQLTKAQNHNTLWCDKDMKLKETHHAMLQKATEKDKLNVLVKWGGEWRFYLNGNQLRNHQWNL